MKNQIVNALSFASPKKRGKKIYVKQLWLSAAEPESEWEGEEDREHLGMELRDRQESLSSAQAAAEGERVVCTHFIHSQTVTGCQQLSDILIQTLVGFTLKKKPPLQGKRDLCISRKLFYY